MMPTRLSTLACVTAACILAPLSPTPATAQRMLATEINTDVTRRVQPVSRDVLATPITIELVDVSLPSALDEIARVSGVPLIYSRDIVPAHRRVTVRGTNITLADALRQALNATDIEPRVATGGRVTLARGVDAHQAVGTIVGKVVNGKTKQPVAHATVTLDDADKGVAAGEDGTFRIQASASEHTVSVRMVGFVRQRTRVTVVDGQTATVDVTLEPSASVLNEVIVTGTVVATERKAIPTPITVISAEDIEKRGVMRLDQLFRGEVPGLLVRESGTTIYGNTKVGQMVSSEMYSRGSASLDGSANPIKTYVDGVELLDPAYLGTIDPKSIERIEIITGPQAATIYGSGAMGGVMQIFTKKGLGSTAPVVTVNLRYGILENNFSNGRTPAHNDALSVMGGAGPAFSYSGNVSYNYQGQWQPKLYNRTYGASVGATHAHGPFTASGSVSTSQTTNGTWNTIIGDYSTKDKFLNGDWVANNYPVGFVSQQVSRASSQTVALSADYRVMQSWQHHLTVGKSQNRFALDPLAPAYASYSDIGTDTLFKSSVSEGSRTTVGYNMTFAVNPLPWLSSSVTAGVNGSNGSQLLVAGCLASASSSTWVGCQYQPVTVSNTLTTDSWGGFGSWQLGVADQLFVTLGLRGERNPAYGSEHKIDWTPTTGMTYAVDLGDLTVKLLGSYGRATRAPTEESRLPVMVNLSRSDPGQVISRFEAPDLTPEYSRGPQGGIELYYGNVGSLTINHFQQTVSGLIQTVAVDSILYTYLPTGEQAYYRQDQNQNVGTVRQQGWEATASLTMGPLLLKGTYSWADSRVLSVNPRSVSWSYAPGESFTGLPTHSGNVTVGYANGGTSVTVVSNYVGSWVGSPAMDRAGYEFLYGRLRMYIDRRNNGYSARTRPGYVKSDIVVSQRLTKTATFTVNVTNAGNNYGSERGSGTPSLGRQTLLGLSLRYP